MSKLIYVYISWHLLVVWFDLTITGMINYIYFINNSLFSIVEQVNNYKVLKIHFETGSYMLASI